MSPRTNEHKARDYAAQHTIVLVPETMGHDGPAIEVWSEDAHMSEFNSFAHTFFARGNTWPQAWADALAYMRSLEECSAYCVCRPVTPVCEICGNSGNVPDFLTTHACHTRVR